MGRAYQNKKDSMAKTAGAKTKVYSKYGKEIYICAKNGGVDPDGNLALRRLIERAKKDQVPTHVIERAIDKAKGGGGEDYVATRYEGYGPGNCMIIVDCLTDNNKRTFADVRVCFTKANAKIGAQNSVSHLFDHLAIFVFDGDDDEAVLEALMMADVDVTDVEVEDGKITVFAPHTEYNNTRTALEEMGITDFHEDLIAFVPQVEAP
ncbi:YebC/PmpR family DNA-binding transcriptional regulator, partial [Pseudoalteromonas sp.]